MTAAFPNDEVIPGIGSGILHPKVSNRFRVLYTVTVDQEEDREQVRTAMRFLSMQTIGLKPPVQRFDGTITAHGPIHKLLTSIAVAGDLEITVEDDITHALARSIPMLLNRSEVTIEVQLLDGCEGVLEILLYGRCKLKSLARAPMECAKSEAIRHTLTFQVGYAQHGVLTPSQSQEI